MCCALHVGNREGIDDALGIWFKSAGSPSRPSVLSVRNGLVGPARARRNARPERASRTVASTSKLREIRLNHARNRGWAECVAGTNGLMRRLRRIWPDWRGASRRASPQFAVIPGRFTATISGVSTEHLDRLEPRFLQSFRSKPDAHRDC